MASRRFPPGPSLFGALRYMQAFGGRDLAAIPRFFTRATRRYGPLVHWRVGRQHVYLADDPALIETVLVTDARSYKKGRGVERLRPLLGSGLLTNEPPDHLRRRRLMQPAFARERIRAYGRTMVADATAMLDGWRDGQTLAIDREMTALTLTIAARTLFGVEIGAETDAIRAALTTVMRTFPATFSRLYELVETLPLLPAVRRFRRARAALDRVVYRIIGERRAAGSSDGDDLLALLLAAGEGADALDDVEVRDEVLTLFIAGHETTANALAWAWYELARRPELGVRLAAEADAVLAGRPPAAADVPALTFTRDVFAEALRLYPPAWVVSRRALRNTTLGGWEVPAGAVVIASQLTTQRNPRYWPDAERFDPDRWRDGRVPAERFAYFPFGGGNRRCIGDGFAWTEGVLILAAVAQRFAVEAVDDAPVAAEPLVTLRPKTPIRVRLRERPGRNAAPVPCEARAPLL